MPLVPMKELLLKAQQQKYGVGAFNCNNMELVKAIAEAAMLEQAPVIIQASQGAIKYAGLNYIAGLVKIAAEDSTVPIALHLDHGTSFEQIIRCIRMGFTSVMFDGSNLPLAENIVMTRKVIEIARTVGVSVEAELGKIGGNEDHIHVDERDALFTNPQEAQTFVAETGVDALAVAIGTAHGQYKGEPRLDFARLQQIHDLVPCPIVLHGSSGVPDDSVRKAIGLGVCKINIDTNIREAFVWAMQKILHRDPALIDPRQVLGAGQQATINLIREKIRVFGSSGKA